MADFGLWLRSVLTLDTWESVIAETEGDWSAVQAHDAATRLVEAHGVPSAGRSTAWLIWSGGWALRKSAPAPEGQYHKLLHSGRAEARVVRQIDLDIGRTGLKCERLRARVRDVLVAYAARNPRLGYCQGMNFAAAQLLRSGSCSDSTCFWTLCGLVEVMLPEHFTEGMHGVQEDTQLLSALLKEALPDVARHLTRHLGGDLELLTPSWFISLFTNSMPSPVVLRLWDLLFLEGANGAAALLRAALGLLRLAAKDVLAAETDVDAYEAVRERGLRVQSLSELLEAQPPLGDLALQRRRLRPLGLGRRRRPRVGGPSSARKSPRKSTSAAAAAVNNNDENCAPNLRR